MHFTEYKPKRKKSNKDLRICCPSCGKTSSVTSNSFIGKYVICPACGKKWNWQEKSGILSIEKKENL